MIEQLVITERAEVITPIIYIIVVAISYYGPNAHIIGGIGATVWHLVKIQDINAYFTTLFLMVGISVGNGIPKRLRDYFLNFSIKAAFTFYSVSKYRKFSSKVGFPI